MNAALWTAQILLALFFLAAGYMHGLVPPDQAAKSAPWIVDLPAGLVRFIAAAELAGGIGVVLPAALRVLPRLTPVSAIGLMTIMLLAIAFHLSRGEARLIGMHICVAAIAAFVAWGRFRRVPIGPR
jgi:putative oxidoreductase